MTRKATRRQKIVVRVLGATEIRVGQRQIELKQEGLFALALYMTTRAGELVSREELLEVFWPTGKEEDRRHAMRQMFYRLRQVGVAVSERGGSVMLDRELVSSDVLDVLRSDWTDTAEPEQVSRALQLGPIFSSRAPSGFLEWFDRARTAVQQRALRAALGLIHNARSQGRWIEVEDWARKVLIADQLNEEATLALAESAAMCGAKTRAIEILDSYLVELGQSSAEVLRPAQALRKRIAERRPTWTRSDSREVPLVGRQDVFAQLARSVESTATSESIPVIVVGASGLGKSRLLAEVAEYSSLRGVRVVQVRAEPSMQVHAWSVARSVSSALLNLPGAAGVTPAAMETLRLLVGSRPDGSQPLGFNPMRTDDTVCDAIIELVHSVAEEVRLALLVDDLHHADSETVSILPRLLSSTRGSRCSAIAFTQPVLTRALRASDGRGSLRTLDLAPLSTSESHHLARAILAAHERSLDAEHISKVVRHSGGNPLFVRELALAQSRAPSHSSLPRTLTDVIQHTLSLQGSSATRVLRAVALLGDLAQPQRVQRASALGSQEFIETVDSLSHEGILGTSQDQTLRLHDAWRDAVLSSAPPAVTAVLAAECAAALADDAAGPSAHRQLSELYLLAGDNERSLEYLMRCVDALFAAGLYESGLARVLESRSRVRGGILAARLRVREALGHLVMGRPEGALPLAESVWRSRELQSWPHHAEHLLALEIAADCHIKLLRPDPGIGSELLSLSRSRDFSEAHRARACLIGVRLVANGSDTFLLNEFSDSIGELGGIATSSPSIALARLIILAEAGSPEEVVCAAKGMATVDRSGLSVYDRCLLLRCTAHAWRLAGRYAEAVRDCAAGYDLALEYGTPYPARLAAELMCNIELDQGHIGEATRWMARAQHSRDSEPECIPTSSMQHIADKIDVIGENPEAVARRAATRLRQIRAVGNTQGHAGELAVVAYAMRLASSGSETEDVIDEALEAVRPFVGRYPADFPMDLLLKAAKHAPAEGAVLQLARKHVEMRRAHSASFAPVLSELTRLANGYGVEIATNSPVLPTSAGS